MWKIISDVSLFFIPVYASVYKCTLTMFLYWFHFNLDIIYVSWQRQIPVVQKMSRDRQRRQILRLLNLESQQNRRTKLPFVSLGGNSIPVREGKESLFTCNHQFALSCLPEASIPLSAVWACHPARWVVTNPLNKFLQAVIFDTTVCSKIPRAASGNWFLYTYLMHPIVPFYKYTATLNSTIHSAHSIL
jgi:hypothetical protein